MLPPKEPAKAARPATQYPKFELPGEAIARKVKEQREARLALREASADAPQPSRVVSAPRVKSTKPPTKATFELPGEALSRRKREAQEARLVSYSFIDRITAFHSLPWLSVYTNINFQRVQEEEERKRREFKAKPIRKSVAPAPRDTVASRARQGIMEAGSMDSENLQVAKRGSVIGVQRPSAQPHSTSANTSVHRSAPSGAIERKPSTKFNGPSMSGMATQRVSSTDVQVQRQRGKEIYSRDLRLTEDIEREKREREAAAKRSREEAAERGRQASREWAEKQRMRKMAEGDKGLGVGYGPGGQMGLRG